MTHDFGSGPVRPFQRAWKISLLLLAFCGCGDHQEEEDHHLEHLIPAHKPASFSEAVTELNSRGPAVFAGQAMDNARRELLDIIDWLPELAADSDLRRKQWEQVRDTGLDLRQIITSPTAEASQPHWDELVGELAALVPASDTWSHRSRTEDASTPTPADEKSSAADVAEGVHHD